MNVREHIPLSTLTTFRVGGAARYVIDCTSVAEVQEAVLFARNQDLPYYVLGEGSNVLPTADGFRGVIIRIHIFGIERTEEDEHTVVIAGAGVSWDFLVQEAAKRVLWGIENLAGIPGTVGAAPVQNIGAYGAELVDTLAYVEALNVRTGSVETIPVTECALTYRDSRFKREPHLIILRVALTLKHKGEPRLSYADLAAWKASGKDLLSPRTIGEAVRAIRKDKFPDLAVSGTAGSFFKNPIISEDAYNELVARHGAIPSYPNPNGVKIPLAFVLDKILKLRGFRRGHAWLFEKQPLVLVADRGCTADEIESLASLVESRVQETIKIKIEREVRTLNA